MPVLSTSSGKEYVHTVKVSSALSQLERSLFLTVTAQLKRKKT